MRLFLDRGCRRITTGSKYGMKPRRKREDCRFVRFMPRTGLTDLLRGNARMDR